MPFKVPRHNPKAPSCYASIYGFIASPIIPLSIPS